MRKTIIAVLGRSNCGKSHAIQTLIKGFIGLPEIHIVAQSYIGDANYDRWIIAEYTADEQKRRIGITSEGDPDSTLGDILHMFVSKRCDVILCPARTRGETRSLVCNVHEENGYDIVWTSSICYEATSTGTDDSNSYVQNALNGILADMLMKTVMRIVEKDRT